MKQKNNTRKNKQKGGEPYKLENGFKEIFYELYNSDPHTYTDEKTKELNDKILKLYNKPLSNGIINAQEIYDSQPDIYKNDTFTQFISTTRKIIDDTKISQESKYIKLSDSFSNLCFDNSFKDRFIKHLINLRYITIYNHEILILELRQSLIDIYLMIANCDAGILEKNTPIEVRELLNYFITEPIKYPPRKIIEFARDNSSQIKEQLSLTKPSPTNDSSNTSAFLSSLKEVLRDVKSEFKGIASDIANVDTRGATNIVFSHEPFQPLTGRNVKGSKSTSVDADDFSGKKEIEEIIVDSLEDKSTINSARCGFSLLVNYYVNNTISAVDLNFKIERDKVADAISKSDTKKAIKHAFDAEITRIKATAAAPGSHTIISSIAKSLGYGLAPASFGLTILGGWMIDLILNSIYESNTVKTLNENLLYNTDFIKSKKIFLKKLFEDSLEIKDKNERCLPEDRIKNYTIAYNIYNEYLKKCSSNYDNYLNDFNDFKYIYDLLCDKTVEQKVKFINSNIDADAITDENQYTIEEKVNLLYNKLESTSSCKDSILLSSYFKNKNDEPRTELKKKNILRMSISKNKIIPDIQKLRCTTDGKKFGEFVNTYIKDFLGTDTTNVPTATATANVPTATANVPTATANVPTASDNVPTASDNVPISKGGGAIKLRKRKSRKLRKRKTQRRRQKTKRRR